MNAKMRQVMQHVPGSSLMDTAVVFEELGKGPVSGPFFSSARYAGTDAVGLDSLLYASQIASLIVDYYD
jgi:hypothetical protein